MRSGGCVPCGNFRKFGSGVRFPTTLSPWQKTLRKQTESLQRGKRRMCAISSPEHLQKGPRLQLCLFDYFISASKQCGWDREAESFGGLEVDDQREFGSPGFSPLSIRSTYEAALA